MTERVWIAAVLVAGALLMGGLFGRLVLAAIAEVEEAMLP